MKLLSKSYFLTVLFAVSLFTTASQAQDSKIDPAIMIGAWSSTLEIEEASYTQVSIVDPSYFSVSIFNATDQTFFGTYGGKWELSGNQLVLNLEFHSLQAELVGTTQTMNVRYEDGLLRFGEEELSWEQIDNGSPGELKGAWLITGRVRDGELRQREEGPRKTMKILSGTRFQWIAYNTETKAFMGTGGGTYTTVNGKYTETIEFFSRDNSRVGAVLPFDYAFKDHHWHHQGLSSKGQPIYEIWTLRTILDEETKD